MSTCPRAVRPVSIGAIALFAVLALAACGSNSSTGSGATTTSTTVAPSGVTIVGPWVLSSYTGTNGSVPATPGATMTFAADGTFNANTGCNVLNGTSTTSGRSTTIIPGPMTQRACIDPAVEAQEQALVTGLPKVTTSAIAGTQLTLSDSSGSLFVFSAGPTGLEGPSWKVTGVNNGTEAVVGTSLTEALTLEFAAGGVVSGFNGCNSFSGAYTTSGTSITISTNLATSLIACEPDVDALAQQYTTALTASTTFELSGSMLTLRDAQGAMQVTATSS